MSDFTTSHAELNSASSNIILAEAGAERAIGFDYIEAKDQDGEEGGRYEDNESVGLSDEAGERSLYVDNRSSPRMVDAHVANERDEE